MCRKRLSSPRCRSELIGSAWIVIVPGQKGITTIMDSCEGKSARKKSSRRERTGMKNIQFSYDYHLPVNNIDVKVCKIFFLRTIGYKYDTSIIKMYRLMTPITIRPVQDRRDKLAPKHAMAQDALNLID